jgi:pyrroline-5-carboxylate reductase
VVLAVKPQVVERALAGTQTAFASDKLMVSVCAGVGTEQLESLAGEGVRVIRAMPNTPALVGQGATALARGRLATDRDETFATELFESVGRCWLVAEAQLDAVTGLSGSGPGFVMLFLEALADGGVRAGLPRAVASQSAIQPVLGSAALAASSESHPAQLNARVTSPAGTTIEGIAALERGGFRHAVIDAVCSAAARSAALGKR